MFKFVSFIIISSFISFHIFGQHKQITVEGYVLNSQSKIPLENCNIFIKKNNIGNTTDSLGHFNFYLEPGKYNLTFSYIGFESENITINLINKKIEIKVELDPIVLSGKEVEVMGKREHASIVIQKIGSEDIQKMPTIYSDVLRSVQVLSGVTTNSELTSGYNVRGGTFDENLIYLNGYEIYRPFLLRIGVEENQSTINPDMVEKLTFFNGAFPASYGDRMSSALEVEYSSTNQKKLNGTLHASILNAGINLKSKTNKFNWNFGARYAYPAAFLSSLKSRGDYKPSFSDVQLLVDYKLDQNSSIEFLGLYADNRFDISPTNWSGNFGFLGRGDYRGISIVSEGERIYSYLNSLLGIKYKTSISGKSHFNFSLSRYWVNEKEKYDVSSKIYYFPDAFNPTQNLEYLKSRFEKGDNSVALKSYRLKTEYKTNYKLNNFQLGAEYRFAKIDNYNYENFNEIGDSLVTEKPINSQYNSSYNLNSFSIFLEDYILFNEYFEANIGIRYLKYNYSKENLISPRAYLTYKYSPFSSLKVSWGYYYQPPFINELKSTQIENLKSQRAIHYILGWENQVNEKLKFNAEIYYKKLDRLIPFYFDEFRMVYVDKNSREGYAFGIDLMYEGEIVEGMKSWVGYSYLDTKERKIGEKKYQRRLLDQTHTLQIFLQDKMRKHPNWQSHLRFLLGSGYLYYQRKLLTDEQTSETFVDISFDDPQEYFFYFRVDMGLSAKFNIGKNYNITAIAEILNVFNQLNAGAYEWVHIFKDISAPLNIPHVLSKRFFNFNVKLSF